MRQAEGPGERGGQGEEGGRERRGARGRRRRRGVEVEEGGVEREEGGQGEEGRGTGRKGPGGGGGRGAREGGKGRRGRGRGGGAGCFCLAFNTRAVYWRREWKVPGRMGLSYGVEMSKCVELRRHRGEKKSQRRTRGEVGEGVELLGAALSRPGSRGKKEVWTQQGLLRAGPKDKGTEEARRACVYRGWGVGGCMIYGDWGPGDKVTAG